MRRPLARTLLLSAPGWARNELWRRARAVPSLDLRFADSKSLTDAVSGQNLITFTRASDATFVNSQGVLTTASSNVPRFDHNPTTGESLGLLIEEQRTNSIRNNTMVGAVAGTPGTLPTNWSESLAGLTRQVVAVGTQNGINYIDLRFSGTSTGTQFIIRWTGAAEAAVSDGQTFTHSLWASLVLGSLPSGSVFITSNLFTSGGVYIADFGSLHIKPSITASLNRFSVTGTINSPTAGFARPYIYFLMANGEAVDFTLRIGMPQLEQGAFATSVIPTTGTAATRSADVASITGSAFSGFYRQDQGTVFADFERNTAIASTSTIVSINDSTTNNRLFNFRHDSSSALTSISVLAGVTEVASTVSLNSGSTRNRAAAAQVLNNFAIAANGGSPGIDTSTGMALVSQMQIGNVIGISQYNGHIRRLTYWPQRLGNEVLQRITL